MTPRFRTPPSPLGSYDKQPGSGAVWRMRILEGQRGRIALADGRDLEVVSNNPGVVPMDDDVFTDTPAPGNVRIIEFYGLSNGTSMIGAWQDGEAVVSLQVQVASVAGKHAIIQLDPPQMALNAAGTPVPYTMKYSKPFTGDTDPADIIAEVTSKDWLTHLAFSCHGSAEGFLDIGRGFNIDNVKLFSDLRSTGINVIWIGACSVAGGSSGNRFCAELARQAACWVVAPGMTIPPVKVGINQVELFTGSLPHYYDSRGTLVTAKDFLKLGPDLGFRLLGAK